MTSKEPICTARLTFTLTTIAAPFSTSLLDPEHLQFEFDHRHRTNQTQNKNKNKNKSPRCKKLCWIRKHDIHARSWLHNVDPAKMWTSGELRAVWQDAVAKWGCGKPAGYGGGIRVWRTWRFRHCCMKAFPPSEDTCLVNVVVVVVGGPHGHLWVN